MMKRNNWEKKWCTKPLKIAYKDDILMSVRAPVGDLNIADRKCIIGRELCNKDKIKQRKIFILFIESGS